MSKWISKQLIIWIIRLTAKVLRNFICSSTQDNVLYISMVFYATVLFREWCTFTVICVVSPYHTKWSSLQKQRLYNVNVRMQQNYRIMFLWWISLGLNFLNNNNNNPFRHRVLLHRFFNPFWLLKPNDLFPYTLTVNPCPLQLMKP